MNIAIVGVGAVGGVFGARLIAAGHTVHFIARGNTLSALRANGLQLTSIDGDLSLPLVHATNDIASIGVVDVVLVCVKSTQVASIAPTLAPMVGPRTAVIPLQNGVEASTQLAQALGEANVLEGLARVIAEQTGPGVIRHMAVTPVIEFGARMRTPADSLAREQIAAFAQAVNAAGMHAIVPESMELALWEKFLFIDPFGTVGAATREPIGVMRADPDVRALIDRCLAEVQAVGVACGVEMPNSAVKRTWERYDSLPPESTTSMQRDLIARRPSEFELQTGSVVRLGRAHHVPTPVHDVLYAVLKPAATAGGTPI